MDRFRTISASYLLAVGLLLMLLTACTPYIVAPAATAAPTIAATVNQTTILPADSPVEFVWALPYGTLSYPKHLAVDKQGNVYVPDSGHDRMMKFDSNGNLLTTWGGTGVGEGQFIFICPGECKPACPPLPPGWPRCYHLPSGGVAVDEQGHVFVADFNGRIQKFDSNGKFLTVWGRRGTGDGEFLHSPDGLVVDQEGNVYAVDGGNYRVQKFDNNGKFLMKWGRQGSGEDEFAGPFDLAFDSQGNLYVVDDGDTPIEKFDSQGKFLAEWGSIGGSAGEFAGAPEGIAVDSHDHVYVVDNAGSRVLKFDSNGNFLGQWGSQGGGDGQFSAPTGIGIDGEDNIYIAERTNHRVQKFRQR